MGRMVLPFYLSTQRAEPHILHNLKKENKMKPVPKYRLSFTKKELIILYNNLPDILCREIKTKIGYTLMKIHTNGG